MNSFLWFAAGAAVCAAVSTCLLIREHRRMKALLRETLQKLDQAIGGNLQEVSYDESMDGAVTERLNKLVEMAGTQRDRAQEERDAVKALISDITHQVRTPLSNIMLYTDLLQEQPLDKEALLLAGKIRRQSEKLEFFMKELVRSSYTEQEMIAVKPEKIRADRLIGRACQAVEMEALKKNVLISFGGTELTCCVDLKWTAEALGNILDNAVKYAPEGSVVEIGAIPYDSFLCIVVKDQGPGIRESEQGLIFQRFYRSPEAAKVPGFGIGLYLAREILSRQGGYIKVMSKPGGGAVFQLFLPLYPTVG